MQDYSWVPTQAGGMMGGRDIVALLVADARHKPVIADLVDRAPMMSDDEFARLATPMPWYKLALTEMRRRIAQQAALATAEGYVASMGEIVETKPLRGVVVRHTGPETNYTPPARAGRPMMMVIKTGDILFVTKNETWHGSLALGMPQIRVEVIQADASREDYFRHYEREAPSMEMRQAPGEWSRPASMQENNGLFSIIRTT